MQISLDVQFRLGKKEQALSDDVIVKLQLTHCILWLGNRLKHFKTQYLA